MASVSIDSYDDPRSEFDFADSTEITITILRQNYGHKQPRAATAGLDEKNVLIPRAGS
jgi:hypothetical protein